LARGRSRPRGGHNGWTTGWTTVETNESGGDAGNGLLPSGQPLQIGGPTDTSVAVDPDFVGDWVKHTRRLLAGTGAGRVAYWALDNEPTLWHETHQDVRFGDRRLASPELGYDELWERTVAYASAIRQADPEARILGPVAWGWCAYFTSAKDKCQPGPDRAAHGGKPLLQWYLQQVCAYQKTTGVRLIDVLDVHYYPENERAPEDESPGEQARRLDAPRALHEKGYTDGSWIGEAIELLPRLQTWIKEECPGTGLAITEYRFGGAQNGISSTLANAEAMLLFGRHGVEVATYWGNLVKGGLLENAWRLFLDYDNKGSSALGGRALVASSADPRALPVYGIRTADHNLIYIFNKSDRPRSVRLSGAVASGRRFVLGRAGLTETRGVGNDLVVPALSVLLLETAS